MEAKGLKLACLYSYGCQQVKRMKAGKELLKFLEAPDSESPPLSIITILRKLQSYLGYCHIRDLARKKNHFDPKVVRAYWLGDPSLRPNYFNHNFVTLKRFKSIKIIEHLPIELIEKMLDCAISFGRVTDIKNKKRAEVSNQRLLYKDGKVIFGTKKREINTSFVANLKKNDLVSIHLGIAREKISQDQAENLKDITLQALRFLELQNSMIE